MSKAGLSGLQLATADIVTVARSLTADEWKDTSAAQGWSVQDVVSHAGNLLTVVMDAVNGQLVTPDGIGIEALNDQQVAEHRGWDPLATVDFLESNWPRRFRRSPPSRTSRTHPWRQNCWTWAATNYTPSSTCSHSTSLPNLRFDILAPRGPIERQLDPLGESPPRAGP